MQIKQAFRRKELNTYWFYLIQIYDRTPQILTDFIGNWGVL